MARKIKNIAVIGGQWGDEGKGKIVDYLAKSADLVVRFHGGNNAGHTVVNKFGTFKMHLIPSGAFYPQTKIVIGNGVVIDPPILLQEIQNLNKAALKLTGRLFISPKCHVIMPYHKLLDYLYEKHKGNKKVGTTGRGIGPVHADKVSYMGIRLVDLLDTKILEERLQLYLPIKNKILVALGGKKLKIKAILNDYLQFGQRLKPYIIDPTLLLGQAMKNGEKIIFEGAHGLLLDNDWGTYPYVTASSVVPGSIQSGCSFNPILLNRTIGVVKAYTTRVGAGPMPTELKDEQGDKFRQIGNEYGSTTGRPRRCGWFDIQLVRYSCQIGRFTELALTKLDVLSSFKKILVCTQYKFGGRKVSFGKLGTEQLGSVQPIYEEMEGWNQPIDKMRSFDDLPLQCKRYIVFLEQILGLPIKLISVGPHRQAIIKRLKKYAHRTDI